MSKFSKFRESRAKEKGEILGASTISSELGRMLEGEMKKALRAYGAVLRLVRRLPKDTRPYYAKYVRENFVNYRDVDPNDSSSLHELFERTYNHSLWVLNKYSVDKAAAEKLKEICYG